MYNEEQKMRFIDSVGFSDSNKSWAKDVFNSVENAERDNNKDISIMSGNEVGSALSCSGAVSSITISNRSSLIIRYKNWCADNGIDSVVIDSPDIVCDLSDNLRQTMVCTPKNLERLLKEAFKDTPGMNTMAPVYRAYLWFAFSGIFEYDAVEIRERDVNIKDLVVNVKGRWYELYAEGIEDIKSSIGMNIVCRVINGEKRTFKRDRSDKVLRGRNLDKESTTEKYVKGTMRNVIRGHMADSGHAGVSYNKIQKSGLFYGMLKREIKGFVPNFYTIACDDYERNKHKELSDAIRKKSIARTVLSYKKDYDIWKKAFNEELKEEFNTDFIP